MQHCIILNANKAVGCGIFRRFSNLNKCRLEAGRDVISGTALDCVGVDVPAGFGDLQLNSGRIIRLFVRTDPFCALCAVFNNILLPIGSRRCESRTRNTLQIPKIGDLKTPPLNYCQTVADGATP